MVGNPQVTSHAGLQKALYVLDVIKGLPAGDVIYKQVEQVLIDFQNNQEQVERTYYAVVHALLDAYLQHLKPGSPLFVQVSILQRRLHPPIWSSDLDLLKDQVEMYADHILSMGKIDEEKLCNSLSAFVEGDVTKKRSQGQRKEDGVKTDVTQPPHDKGLPEGQSLPQDQGPSEEQGMPQDQGPSEEQGMPQDQSPSEEQGMPQDQSLQFLNEYLEEDIQNSISQNQEFGVVLDLLDTELKEMVSKEGAENVRGRMMDLVGKLKGSHGELVENLQDAVEVLSSVEGDKSKLDEELRRARMLSMTDELTELPNRRAFLDRLEDEVGRVKRHHVPLSLALIDLDEFKSINDLHGHVAGDQVLRSYAEDVFSLFRQYDMVARYGGEEFAVLLPNTDQEGAICALSKAMDIVKNLRCTCNDETIRVPSFSAGIAVYHEGEVANTFIDRADQALYRAKSMGRNRVEYSIS